MCVYNIECQCKIYARVRCIITFRSSFFDHFNAGVIGFRQIDCWMNRNNSENNIRIHRKLEIYICLLNNAYVCSNRIYSISKILIKMEKFGDHLQILIWQETRIESLGLEPIKSYTHNQSTEITIRIYVKRKRMFKTWFKNVDYFREK